MLELDPKFPCIEAREQKSSQVWRTQTRYKQSHSQLAMTPLPQSAVHGVSSGSSGVCALTCVEYCCCWCSDSRAGVRAGGGRGRGCRCLPVQLAPEVEGGAVTQSKPFYHPPSGGLQSFTILRKLCSHTINIVRYARKVVQRRYYMNWFQELPSRTLSKVYVWFELFL